MILLWVLIAYVMVAFVYIAAVAVNKLPTAYDERYGPSEKVAYLRYTAYRMMMLAPIWPVAVAGLMHNSYKSAKLEAQPYVLRQQTQALEKAEKFARDLGKAQKDAEAAIDKARDVKW